MDRVLEQGTKWYFKWWAVLVAILLFGPLAIPLVLFNPALKDRPWLKALIILATLVMTLLAIQASVEIIKEILKEARDLEKVLR